MVRFHMRMRQATLGSSVVLMAVLGGCAQISNAPAVEEASFNQNSMASGIYHVQRGDTIYSIGWKTGIDFRRLASLNNLEPPYAIEPGQALRLNDNVSAPSMASASSASSSGTSGTHATALSGAQGTDSSGGDDSWLSPDEDSINRNRSTGGNADSQTQLSQGAIGAAAGVGAAAGSAASSGSGGSQDSSQGSAPTQDNSASSGSSSADKEDTGGAAVAGKTTSEDRSDRTYTPTSDIQWQWPTQGKIVGDFGDKTNLTAGIDIAGQKGQPVKAAGPGIVVYAGDGVRGYGNLIILKHNDHFLSAYAHNDALNVKENDVVRQGETIATMGSTDADGVKLHFEIRQDGQPKDPMQYLPDR
ncbi:peptidoglycan DD-metalloendopeptidase family protein [uncultured Kushneria sp.]|uniref:peptidoglycan DD-metalloendopeptidase family protein n=1 Tax=uncultured Kushneria sp. TaxID=905033 RepID=UPI00260E7045|nr:peptidoglycan DD-metalloendopeptidase family protein [uncultured Kushneria sp.]